jgi:hypothetical protein
MKNAESSLWAKVRLRWKWALVYAVIGSSFVPWYGYGWAAYVFGFRDPPPMDWHVEMWTRLFAMPWLVYWALMLHQKRALRNEVIEAARQLNGHVGPIENGGLNRDLIFPAFHLCNLRRAINRMEGRPAGYQPEPIRFL